MLMDESVNLTFVIPFIAIFTNWVENGALELTEQPIMIFINSNQDYKPRHTTK